MNKFKKYLKREFDVDYLACVHGMSLVFVYGFLLYLIGIKSLSYAVIIELFILGYVISWTQKLLFLEEKIMSKKEFWLRAALWCILPNAECFIAGKFLHWFTDKPLWLEPSMYLLMLCYYIMVLWSIEVFYKEDTKEMNDLLRSYKQKEN